VTLAHPLAGPLASPLAGEGVSFPPELAGWAAKVADVQSGASDALVLCIGDSTTAGLGSNGHAYENGYANSWPVQLAALLRSAGLNARADSFMGARYNVTPAEDAEYDPRLTFGGAWGFGATSTLGGPAMYNAEGAGTLAFAPGVNTSALDVYYLSLNGLGSATVNVNGGSTLATVDMNQASAVRKQTVTATLGSNTWNIVRAAGSAYMLGAVARNAAVKQVSVVNAGWSSATTDNWNYTDTPQNVWNPLPAIQAVAPDLSIIGLGINDWLNTVDVEDYATRLGNVIDAAQASGDVLLWTEVPSNTILLATMQEYVDAAKAVAADKGVLVVDTFAQFGSFSAANGLGWMFDDAHPTGTGYGVIAQALADRLI